MLCARCVVFNMVHTIVASCRVSGELIDLKLLMNIGRNDFIISHSSYFCRQCWQSRHLNDGHLRNHKPLTRNSKTQQILGVGPAMFPPLSVGSSSSGSSGNGSNPGSPTTPPTDGLNSMAMLNFRLK